MNLEGLTGLVNRVIAWADRMQREHGVLGFPYAVVKKYGDDEGGRQAALITYYGFLSIFPLLLLGVAILSRVLADHPDLRQRLITAIVPQALRSTVDHSLATLPTSTVPFVVGLIGLLFSGTGVVFSAYQTLNQVAAVRHRLRAGFFSRYARVFAVLAMLLLGALATGSLTVVATALPGQPGVQRAAAVLGSALVVFAVLLFGSKLLLARAAPVRALWPGAILGAVAVTVVLNAGAPLLARLVAKAGPVYGSFATVAGMFALLYLVGQALVYAAEVAAVRYARLWPRALDLNHPTAADIRALTLRAREEERIPAARVEFHLAAEDSAPGHDDQPHAPTPDRRQVNRVEDQDAERLPVPAMPPERSNLMTEPEPRIDVANLPAPAEGILVTLFLTVRKVARSRDFYSRVLGGTVVLDENPCIVRLSNSWIIMNPGGPPTPDKPDISVVDYQPGDTTSIFLNLRVADIHACYQEWKAKGAEFVTPPIDRGAEIRCYMRDPDGYLIEVGQSTGLLHGKLAAKRPEDLPG